LPLRFGGATCVSKPKFVAIRQTVAEIWWFDFFTMAAVC